MTTLLFHRSRFIIPALIFVAFHAGCFAQARLILNGADMQMSQGVYLIIDNSSANAITRTSGLIVSEGENNIVKWNIGTTTGSYSIPWGYGSNYIPLSFTKTAGVGAGSFLFSTYHTGWQNSTQLPTGISNFNGGSGADKSIFATDRFWQINAQGYATRPALTNLLFTYLDGEFGSPNNTATESGLTAQRWNSNTSTWVDYAPTATTDASANTVSIASVSSVDLQPWWVIDYAQDRHWVASSTSSWNNTSNWSTTVGGPGGASVPSTFDAALFDDVDDANITLGANVTMESLTLNAGYTGTITQGANSITINNAATLSGGTFLGGTAGITVNGAFTLSGASFTSTSGTLDLKDNFTNNGGTFTHNNGNVNFSGTNGVQKINGSAITNFNNITVANTSASPGVEVESDQNLNGVLTLNSNVIFDADGSSNNAVFDLISSNDNQTKDASIATLPGGAQVTGNVTVQRYMALEGGTNSRIYRYISSPVQNASVADLQNEITVTGPFMGSSSCAGCGVSQSMFAYNEQVITDVNKDHKNDFNDGYVNFPVVDNSETLSPGKGYSIFIRGNIMTSALWDVRGIINSGNITLPVTFTSSGNTANDGWNLVGNPYPATIDWNAASGWTKSNLDGAIYVPDNGGASLQYATWNGITGTNGGSRYIAMGQGFWVKGNGVGSPALQVNENSKTAGTQTIFFRKQSPENLIRISLVNKITRDETVIHFRDDATENFDSNADALKLSNAGFNLSSKIGDGRNLAINSLASFDCSALVNLDIENTATGDYHFDFSEFESFSDNISITLVDSFAGNNFSVRDGGSYNFSVTSAPASHGVSRFKLNFTALPPKPDFILTAADICEGTDAELNIPSSQNGVVYVATIDDTVISLPVLGNDNEVKLTISQSELNAGQNTITVKSIGCGIEVKKDIVFHVEKKIDVDTVMGDKSCVATSIMLKAFGAPENCQYNWYESETSVSPIPAQHDSIFKTPYLTQSKTYYVSIVNALKCEGSRLPVVAEIVNYDNAEIMTSGDSLVSNYKEGNQWYFNNKIIPGASGRSIMPTETGVYSTEISVDGCITTADRNFVVSEIESPVSSVVKVFPNPVHNRLNIEIPDSFKGLGEARILNVSGQVIGSFEIQNENGIQTGKFQMMDYPGGEYVVQVPDMNNNVLYIKVIKK